MNWKFAALVGAFVLYLVTRKGTVTMGPLVHADPSPSDLAAPVRQGTGASTGPVNTVNDARPDADLVTLCQRAPINSFGRDCEGITWIRDTLNNPVDLRRQTSPIIETFPGFLPEGEVILSGDPSWSDGSWITPPQAAYG